MLHIPQQMKAINKHFFLLKFKLFRKAKDTNKQPVYDVPSCYLTTYLRTKISLQMLKLFHLP